MKFPIRNNQGLFWYDAIFFENRNGRPSCVAWFCETEEVRSWL